MNPILAVLDKIAAVAITAPEDRQNAADGYRLQLGEPVYMAAAQGRYRFWQHRCGHVGAFRVESPPSLHADCDGCTFPDGREQLLSRYLAADGPDAWSQLFVRAA